VKPVIVNFYRGIKTDKIKKEDPSQKVGSDANHVRETGSIGRGGEKRSEKSLDVKERLPGRKKPLKDERTAAPGNQWQSGGNDDGH